jgi:hypothetical protein
VHDRQTEIPFKMITTSVSCGHPLKQEGLETIETFITMESDARR